MVDYKITKKVKLYETNNCYAHNYYFLIYGKMINTEKNKCRKFKYVEWFDIFDVIEYFGKDFITDNDIKEYLNVIENGYLAGIKDFNDDKGIKEFYEYCNQTINDFNGLQKI